MCLQVILVNDRGRGEMVSHWSPKPIFQVQVLTTLHYPAQRGEERQDMKITSMFFGL